MLCFHCKLNPSSMASKKIAVSAAEQLPVPAHLIERRIYMIRGHKVMLDSDLAELYQVETRALNQAVKRNVNRFPEDFMFQLSKDELSDWRSHFVTSNPASTMGLRRPPFAFTELGVAMLSSVLNSERAVHVNIAIMRAFVKLREVMGTHKELAHKIEALERKYTKHDEELQVVFKAIKRLLEPTPAPTKRRIGFRTLSELRSRFQLESQLGTTATRFAPVTKCDLQSNDSHCFRHQTRHPLRRVRAGV